MALDVKSIPDSAVLFDVDGIPVVYDKSAMTCRAWDSDPPRDFNFGFATHEGEIISKAEFEELMADPNLALNRSK